MQVDATAGSTIQEEKREGIWATQTYRYKFGVVEGNNNALITRIMQETVRGKYWKNCAQEVKNSILTKS